MTVVSDSTPLIHLSSVGDLGLLRDLFGRIKISQAVFHEVVTYGRGRPGAEEVAKASGTWIDVAERAPTAFTLQIMDEQKLQLGEMQTIELATELTAEIVLIDERRAVQFARESGLTVLRTGTIYAASKRSGLISSVRERLIALRASGFWLTDRDYLSILAACGEQP